MLQKLLNKTKLSIFFLGCLLFIFSCNKGDDSTNPVNGDIQIIEDDSDDTFELNFTAPPFDINGAQSRFSGNISYGPFAKNLFDIFMPESDTPTPLVIFIHGGGFLGGDKSYFYNRQENDAWNFPAEIIEILGNNIAVASINYRILEENDQVGVIKSLLDSKRALQFIRSNASILNIEKENIVLYGVSAGSGASLWLNFHYNMADPSNSDEVLRESTRVKGTVALETQATYDLLQWAPRIFSEYDLTFEELLELGEDRVLSFYGINSIDELFTPEIETYREDVDMLSEVTSNDPEFWASNVLRPVVVPTSIGLVVHHAFHVQELKETADLVNLPNVSYYGNPLIYGDPSEETAVEFVIRKLTE